MQRIWFPNAPSGTIDNDQREVIGIGIYKSGTIPPTPIILIDDVPYLRRYLVDSDVLNSPSVAYVAETVANSIDLSYLRRYLGDN